MLIADIMPISLACPDMLRDGGLPNQSPGGAGVMVGQHQHPRPQAMDPPQKGLLDGHLHRDREGRDLRSRHTIRPRSIRKCSVATAARL